MLNLLVHHVTSRLLKLNNVLTYAFEQQPQSQYITYIDVMFVQKIVTSRFVIIYSHDFFRSLKFMCIYVSLRFYLHKRNSTFDTDAYSMRSEWPFGFAVYDTQTIL
jgi:hypothetical protein